MRCTPVRSIPVKMEDQEAVEAVYSVTAGRRHSCALVRLDGRRAVVCWGAYEQRQQGIWPNAFGVFDVNDPDLIPGGGQQGAGMIDNTAHQVYMQGVEPHALVTGDDFNCILDVAGRAYCWGANDKGQLGRGAAVADPNAVDDPNDTGRVWPVSTEARFQALAAGRDHVCGVSIHMGVFCWGSNARAQMGHGAPVPQIQEEPRMIDQLAASPVMSLAAGGGHTVLLHTDAPEILHSWGDNRWNQMGDPAQANGEDFVPPVEVDDFMAEDRLRSILVRTGAGERHSCALDAAGDVVCWGNNELNQCSAVAGDNEIPEPTRLNFP